MTPLQRLASAATSHLTIHVVLALTAAVLSVAGPARADSSTGTATPVLVTSPVEEVTPVLTSPAASGVARDARIVMQAQAALAAPVSREFRAATSKDATRMRGIEPSLYQGKYYMPKRGEDFRRCVIERESRGYYRAANEGSSARGAYQFLDRSWRTSLVHMLRPEAKKNGLLPQLRELKDKPIHKWSRYWQDAAFWTVYNGGEGAKHWGTFGKYQDCGS